MTLSAEFTKQNNYSQHIYAHSKRRAANTVQLLYPLFLWTRPHKSFFLSQPMYREFQNFELHFQLVQSFQIKNTFTVPYLCWILCLTNDSFSALNMFHFEPQLVVFHSGALNGADGGNLQALIDVIVDVPMCACA